MTKTKILTRLLAIDVQTLREILKDAIHTTAALHQ